MVEVVANEWMDPGKKGANYPYIIVIYWSVLVFSYQKQFNLMLKRFSLFTKFLIFAVSLFIILGIILLIASNIVVRNSFINRATATVVRAIRYESQDLLPEDFSLTSPEHAKIVFTSFFERVRTPEIIRVKVWDKSGKVIFSDDQSIIGQSFPDNEGFREAIEGKVFKEIGPQTKPENIAEQGYKQLLEVYTPYTFKGDSAASGVIEAYFKLDDVNSRIEEIQYVLSVTTFTFILASLGILFALFKIVIIKQIEQIKLQAVALDNASDHVIIANTDGVIVYVNKAAEKLTGYTKAEMIGKRPSLWGKQMPKEFYEKMWKTIKVDKKVFEGQITNRRKNGEEYEAEIKITPIQDNERLSFFVGIERDNTKEKEVDRMKTEFISLASHQLRTPLSAIRWFVELLAGTKSLNNDQKEFIANISRSTERMISLVNSLLNISRIDSGRLIIDPKPTDIKSLIEEAVKGVQLRAGGKEQTLAVDIALGLPKINIDPKLIEEVYINLLVNAIKYTPSGGKIAIKVFVKDKDIVSEISDNGLGIPKKDHEKVFQKFYRAGNVSQIVPNGNGLGLYLVKSIVESSRGKIWFESGEGEGTKFSFSLPLSGSVAKSGEVTINS